jgi:hypothetical protein
MNREERDALIAQGIMPPGDFDFPKTIVLPDGGKFPYSPRWSQDEFVRQYNKKTKGYDVVSVKQGAPASLRAILSGAGQESVDATLESKFPWSESIVLSGKPTTFYFDPEENSIFTLDEPGITGGDFADIARQATGAAVEIGATAAATGSKMPLLARAGAVGGAGVVAEKGYEQLMKMFGLKDPRTIKKQSGDFLKDFAIRSAFETVAGGSSKAGRKGLKRVGRGGAPAEETAEGLVNYRRAFMEEPEELATVTGPGSRIEDITNNIVQYFPEWGGRRIRQARERGETVIQRRLDEITGEMAPGDIGELATPHAAGVRARQGILGEKVPGGRLRERQGGWIETARGNLRVRKDALREAMPLETKLYDLPPELGIFGETKAFAGTAPGPGTRSVSSIIAPGPGTPSATPGSPLLGMPQPGAPPQALSPPGGGAAAFTQRPSIDVFEQENLPLRETYDRLAAKAGRDSQPMKIIGEVLDNPDATIGDLLDLKDLIGKNGMGIEGLPAGEGPQLYAAIKETLRQVAGEGTDAAKAMDIYDRTAEAFYDQMTTRIRKIFKVAGDDADPEVAFTRIYSALSGVGNAGKLNDVFSKLDPDDADFVRRAMLDRFFSTASPKTAFKRWESMSPEVKSLVAPEGSTWRLAIDDVVETSGSMKLLDRASGSASSLSKEERSFWREVVKGQKNWQSALGGNAALLALFQHSISGQVDMKLIGVAAGLMTANIAKSMASRLEASGRSRLLTSPAFFDWVASATHAMPGGNAPDQILDFMAMLMPRMGARIVDGSIQDMEDVQYLQQAYLVVLQEALGAPKPAPTPGGLLGQGAMLQPQAGGAPGLLGASHRSRGLFKGGQQ